MTERESSINLDASASEVNDKYKDRLNELLDLVRRLIDDGEMPKAKEFLKPPSKDGKIPRPPNSNLIYTNLLGRFGLTKIVREYCDESKINKQKLVPISKKICKILWQELSENHQKFFDKLASEVSDEHKNEYPNYKYEPKRKSKKGTFIQVDPKPNESEQVDENEQASDNSQDTENELEFDEDIQPPEFEKEPSFSPLNTTL